MVVSDNIKTNFLWLTNFPIPLQNEPIWSDRLKVLGKYEVYEDFVRELQDFHKESEYFDYQNNVLLQATKNISDKKCFTDLAERLKGTRKPFPMLPASVVKEQNIGKWYLSIDIKNAWFNCLRLEEPELFDGCKTWREYLSQFTNYNFLLSSKRFGISVLSKLGLDDLSNTWINRTIDLSNTVLQKYFIDPAAVVVDEVTYEVGGEEEGKELLKKIEPFLSKDLQYHITIFQINGLEIPELNKTALIYKKEDTLKVSGVKRNYYHIAIKKLNNIELTEQDFIV